MWEKICDLIGEPAWKTHPDYAKPPARLPRLKEIFERIEQWTMTETKFEVMNGATPSTSRLARSCR